jgi:hypothetical protein
LNEREFISAQSAKILSEGIKIFPEDFCNLSDAEELDLPEKNLLLGKDFFGLFEITTTEGETVMNLKNRLEAKFIVYSSSKRDKKIKIPKDFKVIADSVKKYENYLDELLTKIKNEYQKQNLKIKNMGSVSGEIFKKLNLIRL